ncbi:OsmC family protein [Halorientalis halophila]|uniref:OsmC family protein n=1 Tax=Halorientalis halophila TaxID=3108499 RepID=UPI00300AB6C3
MASEDPQTETVQHGVDVGDHMAFVDWLEANPEDGRIEFRARGVAEDAVNRTSAAIDEWSLGGEEMGGDRDHTLEFGLPADLEESLGFADPEERYEAIEGALAGLTACINGTIAFNAVREGLAVEEIETRVRVPTDLRVLFGIHDVDRADEMFDEPMIDVTVTGTDLDGEDVERIREYPKRSPVYNLVTLAHANEPSVTVEQA